METYSWKRPSDGEESMLLKRLIGMKRADDLHHHFQLKLNVTSVTQWSRLAKTNEAIPPPKNNCTFHPHES